MSERQLNIKLDIAGKPYELTINAQNEEVYRLAAREINNRLATAQQSRVDGFGVQDYLAIIAVDLMISNIRLERKNSVEDGDLKTLTELAERLSKHLEK
jgi:cell division protein ZapA